MQCAVKTTWNDPMPGIEAAALRGMIEICENVVSEAKSIASGFKEPTGRTMNSISWQVEAESGGFDGSPALSTDKINEPNKRLTGYVGTNVRYAIYQENGTRHIPAFPFIRPAIAIHAQGKNFEDVMRRWAAIHALGPLKQGSSVEGF